MRASQHVRNDGECIWRTTKSSQLLGVFLYRTRRSDQLSLAIPRWVGAVLIRGNLASERTQQSRRRIAPLYALCRRLRSLISFHEPDSNSATRQSMQSVRNTEHCLRVHSVCSNLATFKGPNLLTYLPVYRRNLRHSSRLTRLVDIENTYCRCRLGLRRRQQGFVRSPDSCSALNGIPLASTFNCSSYSPGGAPAAQL